MNTIKLTVKDNLAIITLNRGRSNAMDHEMVNELTDALVNIAGDATIGGAIITGNEGFFSAGLDLITLYNYDRDEAEAFWHVFLKLVATITAFRKPLVAAVNGHSPAGGCVIALACDYRIMAEGKFIIGLNEVPVGIIVPDSIFQLYAFWLGHGMATRSLLEGRLFSPEEAKNAGLIDEIVNPESILTAAERRARKYMAMEPNTWQQSKVNIRRGLIAATSADQSADLKVMLEQWWAPSTRGILKAIIDNLQRK